MLISTRNRAASYSTALVLTGSPIASDAAPTNLASVDPSRRITYPRGFLLSSTAAMCAFALDGTSIVVRNWFYDIGIDLWIPNGTTGTLVSATANSLIQVVGYMPGALFFTQVVSNAGGTTKLATALR